MHRFVSRFFGVLAITLLTLAAVFMMFTTAVVILGSDWGIGAKVGVLIAGCVAVTATIVSSEFIMDATGEA